MKLKGNLLTCSFFILLLCMCGTSSTSPDYSRVIPASQAQINLIKGGLEEGFSISNSYAIKSNAFKRAYFVACNLVGPGVSDAVAVWSITGDPNAPGMILSTNNIAKEFSAYPLGSSTKANISMADEGAYIVRDFVSKKQYTK